MKGSCGNCMYYNDGRCKRYPPIGHPVVTPTRLTPGFEVKMVAEFTPMPPDGVCGECASEYVFPLKSA